MSMPVFKMSRAPIMSGLLKWESNPEFCRETGTLLAGAGAARIVKLGTLLGLITAAGAMAASASADAGNTGNGTMTMADPSTTTAAKAGIYRVVCTTGGADGTSKFRVEDPEGVQVGTATGGAAFTKQIKFTIAGGGTAFAPGDAFSVTVSIAADDDDGKIVAWDPDATNGSEVIHGVSLVEATAADGVDNTTDLLFTRRDSILFIGAIQWPNGLTSDQKAKAVADLKAMPTRIILRD
ncbi:head decoration protein [Aurantimonas sp. VKM B-3413]|uniref:head decoration protein n=1 Tax=Aurantimonas sp. VKM B-3413 TaxID=2779401 RepID=UPI001E4ADF3B|nr:head decoration protein [Aurantimonas sp. VKM B-3413]MCB8835945.1 head decoration protein [Aurantimonas sp. VKM B-3413]